jgi:Raf kinase inhibitor-like YbhB/YbcL family protein
VRSDAFDNMSAMPKKYSADGEAISPPLSWSTIPERTMSLALVVEDPDAPTANPFVHWLLYNIPPDVRGLPEDVRHEEVAAAARRAMQGKNSTLKIGWTGMAPPKGDTPHHYHFQLFALDRVLELGPGAGRTALLEAMPGHIIGRGDLVGTFQR